MSSGLDLQSWTQQHLSALFMSSSDMDETFESTFSTSLVASRNGEGMERDKLKEGFTARRSAMAQGDPNVEWKEMVVVPKDTQNPDDAGSVGGYYTVTRSLKFRIRAGPAQSQATICFNALVEQDPSIQEESADKRRIVQLVETVLDKPVPIHLQAIPSTATPADQNN